MFDKDMWTHTKILTHTDISILCIVINIIKVKTTVHEECREKF
jgi:hypothetical protein